MADEDRIIRESECQRMTGLSRTTRWRLIKAGAFPKKVQLSTHLTGWHLSDIREWLGSREQAVDKLAPMRAQKSKGPRRTDNNHFGAPSQEVAIA